MAQQYPFLTSQNLNSAINSAAGLPISAPPPGLALSGRGLPNEDAITRLIGALLLEQNDEWAVQRGRYMSLETIAPLSDDPIIKLPAVAA